MRSNHITVIILILFGVFWVSAISAHATTREKVPGDQEPVQSQMEIPNDGSSSIQDQKIVLSPFYQLQRKDFKVWTERIVVTFLIALPQGNPKLDLNCPDFRKMLYEMLQSGESETAIQAQAVASLGRQSGMNIDGAVQISRSVMIVH